MRASEAVRALLRSKGCADETADAGLEGLVGDWERTVREVSWGYPLGLDDYLNDLDVRQLLEEALEVALAAEREAVGPRIRAADALMRSLVAPREDCLWGEAVAAREGWTAERNWWYFSVPRSPGALLSGDLENI